MKKVRPLMLVALMSALSLTSCQRIGPVSSSQSESSITSVPKISVGRPSLPSTSIGTPEDITIFSINDFHGKLKQTDNYNGLINLIGAIQSDPNYDPYTSIIVSAGDMWQGGYESGYDKGYTASKIFNAIPLELMELGNHEFDWTVEQIQKNQEVADYPFLCANLVDESTGERPDWIDAWTIVERGDAKIGFVGAIGADLESDIKESALKGYHFTEDTSVIEEAVDECKDAGADYVFFVVHDGPGSSYVTSLKTLGNTLGVKGIFGGHSHTFNDESGLIPYVQGGSDSRGYSYMVLDTSADTIDSHGYKEASSDEVCTNTALKEAVDTYVNSLPIEQYGTIVGYWDKYSSAQFVLAAMKYALKIQYPDLDDKSILAVHNTGGIRGSYPSYDTPQPFTAQDIQTVSPFDNKLVYLPNRMPDGQLRSHYSNPSSIDISFDKAYNIVTIDYLTGDSANGMFDPEESTYLEDPETGEDYIIYDAIADYAAHLADQGIVIDAEDYSY